MSAIPHSMEAEQGLIGSMLIDPRIVAAAVRAGLGGAAFFHPPHATMFDILTDLDASGSPVDFVTVTQILRDRGHLESVGGPASVSQLYTFTPTAANWRTYAGTVLEKAERRALMREADRLRELAASEGEPMDVVRDAAQGIGLAASRRMVANSDVQHVKHATMDFLDAVQAAQAGDDTRYRIETGLPRFDTLTHNLPPGTMVVFGAQTSVGKTALGLQIASSVAFHDTQKRPALVVSLEMTAQKLAGRVAAARSGINLATLNARKPNLSEFDFSRLNGAVNQIMGSELYLWTPEKTPTAAQVAAMVRMQKMTKPELALVVVDYLQLLAPANAKDNRERQVSEMCETLMRCAVGLEVTIVALSQLNDDDKLRDSRAIGHHARVVGILTRPDEDEDTGQRTLHLDKNSEGQAYVSIPLHFDGAHQTFREVSRS